MKRMLVWLKDNEADILFVVMLAFAAAAFGAVVWRANENMRTNPPRTKTKLSQEDDGFIMLPTGNGSFIIIPN